MRNVHAVRRPDRRSLPPRGPISHDAGSPSRPGLKARRASAVLRSLDVPPSSCSPVLSRGGRLRQSGRALEPHHSVFDRETIRCSGDPPTVRGNARCTSPRSHGAEGPHVPRATHRGRIPWSFPRHLGTPSSPHSTCILNPGYQHAKHQQGMPSIILAHTAHRPLYL